MAAGRGTARALSAVHIWVWAEWKCASREVTYQGDFC
jgi:hypothetical protein